jgi:hypothetical protein
MSKGLTVFIALVVFIVSLGTLSGSTFGLGRHDKDRDSAAYKAALSFAIISSLTAFVTVMIISYHGTKLYCS